VFTVIRQEAASPSCHTPRECVRPPQEHSPSAVAMHSCDRYVTIGRQMSFLKSAPSRWEICTPSNTWFLRPTWVIYPNGISIGSAIFAQLTRAQHTDRHTADHATCDIRSTRPRLRAACRRCGLKTRCRFSRLHRDSWRRVISSSNGEAANLPRSSSARRASTVCRAQCPAIICSLRHHSPTNAAAARSILATHDNWL